MASNTFMKVDEVAEMLGISKSYAYKIVQKLNAELKDKGFLTIVPVQLVPQPILFVVDLFFHCLTLPFIIIASLTL